MRAYRADVFTIGYRDKQKKDLSRNRRSTSGIST